MDRFRGIEESLGSGPVGMCALQHTLTVEYMLVSCVIARSAS